MLLYTSRKAIRTCLFRDIGTGLHVSNIQGRFIIKPFLLNFLFIWFDINITICAAYYRVIQTVNILVCRAKFSF